MKLEKKFLLSNKYFRVAIILVFSASILYYFFFDLKKIGIRLLNPLKKSDKITLRIEHKNQKKLKEYLENYTIKKKKPIKKWVDIQIKNDGIYHNAKLKLHGSSAPHYWNSRNRNSYTLKLNSKSFSIDGKEKFKLIIDEECDPSIITINNIANSFGLIAPKGIMKSLIINDRNFGVYGFVEDICKDLLHKDYKINNCSILSNTADWSRKEFKSTGVRHRSDFDLYHGHISAKNSKSHPLALGYYKLFCEYIKSVNIKALKEMIDLEYMGKYLAIASIFNDVHFMTGDNLKFVFDFESKLFYPIYRAENKAARIPENKIASFSEFNSFLFNSLDNENKQYSTSPNLEFFKLLLSDSELRNIRDKFLHNIIINFDDFLFKLESDYHKNKSVMIHSDIFNEKYKSIKKEQISIIKQTINVAKKYIDYGHIYGSFNLSDSTLNLISDAFCAVKITSKNNLFVEKIINGIEFDKKLNIKYQYSDFKIKKHKIEDLVFINMVTKDTIKKEHIYINNILEIKN
jgi:hypothetical protein